MSFATDDLREDILGLFVHEHNKINDFSYVHAELTLVDIEKKKETERKSRLLDLHWIRRQDRERKSKQDRTLEFKRINEKRKAQRKLTKREKLISTTKPCDFCGVTMNMYSVGSNNALIKRFTCSGSCRTRLYQKRSRDKNKCANQKQAQ